ncbi:MAG: helix-turn-helix transcriptional regulator [Lactobacillaceae bacterium]|jgi:DNA-binding HxlR family transcriptional regulator|nr:helix-turn-helix transcriptional regulator [Lactobacillaceae bacterium]
MTFSVEMNDDIAEILVTLNELHRNKWRPEIVNTLLEESPLRFNELQRRLDVSQKVLTENLKWLESKEIITRQVFPEIPPRVEYSLTEIGMELQPVHEAMRVWADEYIKIQKKSQE